MRRWLYMWLLWLTEWDLDFARNTGRNPECVANLSARTHEYNNIIFDIGHPLMG